MTPRAARPQTAGWGGPSAAACGFVQAQASGSLCCVREACPMGFLSGIDPLPLFGCQPSRVFIRLPGDGAVAQKSPSRCWTGRFFSSPPSPPALPPGPHCKKIIGVLGRPTARLSLEKWFPLFGDFFFILASLPFACSSEMLSSQTIASPRRSGSVGSVCQSMQANSRQPSVPLAFSTLFSRFRRPAADGPCSQAQRADKSRSGREARLDSSCHAGRCLWGICCAKPKIRQNATWR